MASLVVVFDFDKTIIDCDSDNWVIDDLGGTCRFDELLLTHPWNSAMDMMMGEFHAQGRTIEEIVASLKRAPLHPNTISAIKDAYALGCELRVVSDANLFFIETILKHHGLMDYFSQIHTNPGYVDEKGRLRILPYHGFHNSSHGCALCPPNMCKSEIIECVKATANAEGKKRFIYLGDGKGDFCPSLRLSERDFVMPRKDYPLWELICSNTHLVEAEVHEWNDAVEQERILLQLIKRSIMEDQAAQLVSPDCKSLNISMPALEAFPKALRVPH